MPNWSALASNEPILKMTIMPKMVNRIEMYSVTCSSNSTPKKMLANIEFRIKLRIKHTIKVIDEIINDDWIIRYLVKYTSASSPLTGKRTRDTPMTIFNKQTVDAKLTLLMR